MATFIGTSADELITADFVSPTVAASGGTRPSGAADVIDGGAGNDVIDGAAGNDTINGGAGNDVLTGGAGNDSVTGGIGSDVAFLGAGNDVFVWNSGDGSDVVAGQGGIDTLVFNGSGADERISILADSDGALLSRDPGNVAMNLTSVEQIQLAALGGADNIVVGDLSGTGVREIDIDLSVLGAGDGQADAVTLEGTSGNNRIDITSSGGSILVNGLPTRVTINGAEASNDSLAVNGLDGNDRIDASRLGAAAIRLAIDGGAGNDTITGSAGNDVLVGGDGNDLMTGGAGRDTASLGAGDDRFVWNPGDGSDVVEGETGIDTLQFNGSDADESISISANGGRSLLSRDVGNVSMDLNSVEHIEIAAAGGVDTIRVADLTGTGITQVAIDLAVGHGRGGDNAPDQVIVEGTAGDDLVTIARSGSDVTLRGFAETVTIARADGAIDQLTLLTGSGNDVIDASNLSANQIGLTIESGAGNDVIHGSRGSDAVNGGAGSDIAFLGAGNDLFTWNPGDGSDFVDGQSGVDTLQFNGAGADEHISISGNGGQAILLRAPGAVSMTLSSVEHVQVAALGGADDIVVNDLADTGVREVNIDLATPAGGDGQPDTVTVNGSAGNDHVTVANSGASVVVEGLSAEVTIAGAEAGSDQLVINGLDGNDRIDASALDAGHINLTIDGGAGNDILTGSAGNDRFASNHGGGSDVVDGGAGSDTLTVNGPDADESVTISASGERALISQEGGASIDADNTETFDFHAFGGADTITVNDMTGTDVHDVSIDLAGAGGGGDGQVDTIVINATAGDDAIHVTSNNGVISVTGLAADVTIFNFEANDRLVINGLAGDDVIEGSGLDAGVSLKGSGGDGDDVLVGGAGDDVLSGGSGDDVLIGGPGTDMLDGGLGDNVVIQSLVVSFDHGLI